MSKIMANQTNSFKINSVHQGYRLNSRSCFKRSKLVKCQTAASESVQSSSPRAIIPGIKYTHYESNSWAVSFNQSDVQFICDPWLVDDLTFTGAEWIFRSKKRVIGKTKPFDLNYVKENMAFILLSQALDDHAHRPTLKALDKSIRIIAPPDAANLVKELGYTNVTAIDHGQEITVCDGKLTIKATEGALVGPPWSKRQNGYVLQENVEGKAGVSFYYEPHCDYAPQSVLAVCPVDIVLSPVTSAYLANYPLVMGYENIFKLLDITKPKKLIRLVNGQTDFEGPLSLGLSEGGSNETFESRLREQGSRYDAVEVVPMAAPGESVEVLIS
eukprot:TRINITY_DN6826_c1_g1_i1.p1 TRINITY_DN6826_c1_g1~~TRINITY_DN6826_c1_g1_i1.p1  ORF type:complete len:329 (+),score=17.23 TRINITY_DN6826_c1_g1_i1:115-1101(+)